MLLLALLLVSVAMDREWPIRFLNSSNAQSNIPIVTPQISSTNERSARTVPQSTDSASQSNTSNEHQTPVCSPPGPEVQVSSRFLDFYNQHGGIQLFGRPISPEINDGGRIIQWFERTRLEEWPEHRGTRYYIQSARVGAEFTKGVVFPQQTFFVSQPDIRYFGETGQGVREPFLSFWQQYGGLDIFGYPISGEVQEELEDGQLHLVQYFERARLEYHPTQSQQIQIGLLGHALCLENSQPRIVTPTQPTPVPLQ